jgi:exoribonuclease-2
MRTPTPASAEKPAGMIIEYLDDGRMRAALATREYANQVVVADASGNERKISRDLVLVRYTDRHPSRERLRESLTQLDEERQRLSAEIDLNLLWEIVREHQRGYNASALAEIFFGRSTPLEHAVMLDALLNDRLYFVRRHMEFVARDEAQVERLRTQYDKIKLRSESGKQSRRLLSGILADGALPPREEISTLIVELTRYLENPFTRNREISGLLEAVAGELTPAEAAYEILVRLGARPPGPRFALIGGLRTSFSPEVQLEAARLAPPARATAAPRWTVTIDDDETVEIDDAISCEPLPGGGFCARVHIALVADFVSKGGPMDAEAAARGATIYLPETSVRMLPDPVSTNSASLQAGVVRHVLTTEVQLSPSGELLAYRIYPERIQVSERLTYERADELLASGDGDKGARSAHLIRAASALAAVLRERRRAAGARLFQRREPKVTVVGDEIDIRIIDNSSPSRELVAELMVLSNYIAARFAAERNVPMIFRVQPNASDETFQRAHLSIHPEFHSGVGLECYVQASSPIRRYVDLVLQRQLISVLNDTAAPAYNGEELLAILAAAESAEAEGRELERRAKRYWTLTYLKRHALDQPLEATVMRDGASAELTAFAVRGLLHGAPNLQINTPIAVTIARVDAVHGHLGLNYLRTLGTAAEKGVA